MEKVIYTLPLDEFTEVIKKCVREELDRSKPAPKEDELLKIEDAVKMFKVSKVTLHKWRKKGLLPFHRIASRIYFKKSELIAALNAAPRRKRPE